MLYFTESGWTPPDIMDVSEKFDEEYDRGKYEQRITRLAGHAIKRARNEGKFERWKDAVRALDSEDHYLSVMIGQVNARVRPPHDRLKLWATAFALVITFMGLELLADRYQADLHRYVGSGADLQLFVWIVLAVVFVLFEAGFAIFGASFTNFCFGLIERLFGIKNKFE